MVVPGAVIYAELFAQALCLDHERCSAAQYNDVAGLAETGVAGDIMQIVVTLDRELLERAKRVTGIEERDEVVREALTALIERETARRVIALARSEPDLVAPPRRRPEPV